MDNNTLIAILFVANMIYLTVSSYIKHKYKD